MMALPSLWRLFQAALMLTNGVAILNNERFLEGRGWGFSQLQQSKTLKMSIIGGIHAVHYFRGILIGLNIIVIFVKLID